MLYLFDLDGTLISSYMDNPDKNYDTWEVLPGRKAMLNRLLMRGDTMCVITNQFRSRNRTVSPRMLRSHHFAHAGAFISSSRAEGSPWPLPWRSSSAHRHPSIVIARHEDRRERAEGSRTAGSVSVR